MQGMTDNNFMDAIRGRFPYRRQAGKMHSAKLSYRGIVAMLAVGFMFTGKGQTAMALDLRSGAFGNGANIPPVHTCDGNDISPPLSWSNVPPAAKSLALIMDDPDAPDPAAPQRTWVHWVLYNIPANISELKQDIASHDLPAGTREGNNDWHRSGYGGPCPPVGSHRYFFKLYALDTVLPDLGKPDKAKLEKAMQGHVIGKAEWIGRYQRK
jgi:Raf kinase inhibitor-like YbhB/YbcL family protein